MTLVSLIRKYVNTRLRLKLYILVISIVGKTKWLLYPLIFMLHGYVPKGISIVNGEPIYKYDGFEVKATIDSYEAYIETFHDKVYDRLATPNEGDIVIDIGAFVGMFSMRASKYVGSSGLVVAVEPLPCNAGYLKDNLKKYPNTRIVNEALSNYIGEGRLYEAPGFEAYSLVYVKDKFVEVKVNTVDNMVKELNLPRVDYIKMDAEGSDLNILEGATETLQKYHPALSLACYHPDIGNVPCAGRVVEFLKTIGYKNIIKFGIGYVYTKKEDQ